MDQLTLHNLREHMWDMQLLGFSVITSTIRSDTKAAIAELQSRSVRPSSHL